MSKTRDTTHRYHCTVCSLTIGKSRQHWLFDRKHVVCVSCVGTSRAHKVIAPDCPEDWHDGYDHPHEMASYAVAIKLVGSPCAEVLR